METRTDRDSIVSEVRGLTAGEFGIELSTIDETTCLADLPNADSIKRLTIASALERRYRISLVDESTPLAATIGELADQVVSGLGASAGRSTVRPNQT